MIGVFDSGLGGLTVLRAIVDRLPKESTVYLGDTARVPYGNKSPEVVTGYALRIARHLLGYHIKVLVVACNTASAQALPALRKALDIPVIGVIEPGAQAAVEQSRGGRIAVLATRGTVRSGAYPRALHKLDKDLQISARPCPLFVPLAEEGLVSGPIVEAIVQMYLRDLKDQIDTAVLGCTHYPLLADSIAAELGPAVRIVDGSAATAKVLAELLDQQDLHDRGERLPQRRFLFTDSLDTTAQLAERFFGAPIAQIEQVDL